jgi:hypothetical protein
VEVVIYVGNPNTVQRVERKFRSRAKLIVALAVAHVDEEADAGLINCRDTNV